MDSPTRRTLLMAGASGAASLMAGCMRPLAAAGARDMEQRNADVAPAEDLMREHGVLDRILLIYEEAERRLHARDAVAANALVAAVEVVQRFIEDYHERLEEEYLFPRFEAAGRFADLVAVLRVQHERGRVLSDDMRRSARNAGASDRERLRRSIRLFVRMYRPHAAREDTVLFPALHEIMGADEYESLGEVFEDREHQLFGPRGFEGVVDEVANLERSLGIYELGEFTP